MLNEKCTKCIKLLSIFQQFKVDKTAYYSCRCRGCHEFTDKNKYGYCIHCWQDIAELINKILSEK